MSASVTQRLGTMVVRLALERAAYAAGLGEAVDATRVAAGAMQGHAAEVAGAANTAAGAVGASAVAVGTVVAAGVVSAGVLMKALSDAQKEHMLYARAVVMTGNAAGVTYDQLRDMARGVDAVAGTQRDAAAALAELAGSGKVAGHNLQWFATVAVEMERATGQSVAKTAGHFAELGEAPVRASLKLNESLNYLTEATYTQIRAAEEMGRKDEAAELAQQAYARAMKERAQQLEQQLGWIEKGWRSVKDAAKEAWDAVLNVGRPASLKDQIDAQQAAVDRLEAQAAKGGLASGEINRKTEAARAYLATLKEQLAVEGITAAAQADAAARERARIELAQALEKTRTKQQQAELAVAAANALADRSGATLAEREALVAAAREKFAEKASRQRGQQQTEQERLIEQGTRLAQSLEAQEAGLSGGFAQQWDSLAAAYAAGAISMERLVAAQAALLEQQPAMKARAKEELEAAKAAEKAQQRAADWVAERLNREADAGMDAARLARDYGAELDRNAARVRFELGLMGQGEQARAVAIRQYEIEEALQRKILEIKKTGASLEATDEAVAAARAAAAQAKLDAAQEVVLKDWQETTRQVGEGLTNALMEGGKSAWEYIKGLFRSMVLKPVIQAVVNPVVNMASGLVSSAMGGLLGSVGLGGFGGVGGVVQGVGNLGAMAGLGGAGGWLAGAGAYGAALGGGAAVGAGSQAAMLASQTGVFGSAGTAATAAAAGNTAVSGLMTAAPYLAALAVVASLFKDDSGTFHTGAESQFSAAQGLSRAPVKDGWTTNALLGSNMQSVVQSDKTQAQTDALARSMVGVFDSVATAFGKQTGYEVATGYADDTAKDGAWGSMAVARNGVKVLNWADTQTSRWAPRVFADGEAGAKEYAAAVAASAREVLMGMDLPAWAAGVLEQLGEAPSMEQLAAGVAQINATKAALVQLGDTMAAFQQLTDNAATVVLARLGGTDAMVQAAQGYYQTYYSEAERFDIATRQVSEALAAVGLQLPGTTAALRAMMEEALALGDAGGPVVATLLQVQGQFAALDEAARAAEAQRLALAEQPALEPLSDAQRLALAQKLGGADALQSAAGAFFEKFTSAAQQEAAQAQAVARKLATAGLAMPSSTAEYLELFAQRMAAGDVDALAVLLDVADAFDTVAASAQASTDALLAQAKSLAPTRVDYQRAQARIALNVPAFADGGAYGGGLALVGEEGPELINFAGPGQVFTARQSASMLDNGAVVAELRELRRGQEMLRAESRATAMHSSKLAVLVDGLVQNGRLRVLTKTEGR